MKTAAVERGSTCVVFGAGMVGLGAVAGCRLQGAERIICVDLSSERLELAKGQGATETMIGGPRRGRTDRRADRRLRSRLHVRGDRQRRGHAPGRRVGPDGWGLCTVAGVAGKGETLEVVPRYLITGRRVAGSSFGGIKGRDEVPQLVDLWLDGRAGRRPVPLAHAHARRREPRLRADACSGWDPQRDLLQLVADSIRSRTAGTSSSRSTTSGWRPPRTNSPACWLAATAASPSRTPAVA